MKKRILSGMRPTGKLHLGHYFGVLQNWVALQGEYDCYFMIADWHALTSEWENAGAIPKNVREIAADWIACGVDPEKSCVFVQSEVPEHLELNMILSCITPLGWLERVPTYKEAREQQNEKVGNYAFLGYPVLQAADILLYKGNVVPVGEDQMPHLELTREIVRRFHSQFKEGIFPEPAGKLTPTPRLIGLDNRRMAKSYGNTIDLSEDLASVEKKVKGMFTDPNRKKRSDPGDPAVCNVFAFHGMLNTKERHGQIETDCKTAKIGCVECKAELAGKMVDWLRPIQERRRALLAEPGKLDALLARGIERARAVAKATMKEVREAVFKVR
ncbi:MAG: tryptophan--tRNA ligase [Planctomycetes bacterium]|nr:tryptophan--tRNA ligase [Planctomycetota bacterium]